MIYKHKSIIKALVVLLTCVGTLQLLAIARPVQAASQSAAYCNLWCGENQALNLALTGCKHSPDEGLALIALSVGGQIFGSSDLNYANYQCLTEPGAATASKVEELKQEYLAGGTGLAGLVTNVNIALLDQRPASGVDFVLARVENTLSPGVVYAADPAPYFPGTGFTLLTPIQSFWGWSVTISYSFMILIILVVAFGLMFQLRLDGKTVVQLQAAIPGIVLAMILIPLTYPIAGLFIDAITLGTNVYHDFLLGPAGPGSEVYKSGAGTDQSQFNTLRGLYADDWRVSVFRVREFISANQLGNVVGGLVCPDATTCSQSGVNILGFVNSIVQFVSADNATLSTLVGSLLNLIFSIIFIVISFKIAWRLIKKFFVLVFFPILLPFVAATVALPGRGTKAMVDQLKQMGAASLQYIVSYIIFLTVIVITNEKFINTIPNAQTYQFNPPLLGASRLATILNGVGQNANATGLTGFLFTLIGMVMFLSLPSILDGIDKALGVPEDVIPSFLKPAIAEFKSSYDVGFRQAPAVVRSGINQIGAGATSVLSSRFVGGRRPGGPFDQTSAEKFVASERNAIGDLRNKAAQSGLLGRQYYNLRANARQFTSNALAGAQGQAGKIAPSREEKNTKINISLSFGLLGVESRFGADNYQMKTSQLKRILGSSSTSIQGSLVIKVQEGTTRPTGAIFLRTLGSSSSGEVIGYLKSSANTAKIILNSSTPQRVDSKKSIIQITDPKKTFSGKDEIDLDISLEGLNDNIQVWDMENPLEKVAVAIGITPDSPIRGLGGMSLRVIP